MGLNSFSFIFFLGIAIESIAQDCPMVKLSDFPKGDLPSASERLQLKSLKKESEDYYYGIGVPVNYVIARHLAFMEWDTSGDEEPFSGAGILLMIYANGYGVKRNLDLCIKLACANVPGAPAEIEGRLAHLKEIKQKSSNDIFDICDDITSGYMMGMCQSRYSMLADIERDSEINKITQSWLPNQRETFLNVRKASDDFVDARSTMEVDLTGTARVMEEDDEADSLKDEFLTATKLVDKCTFPGYSSEDFAKADKELNRVYLKVIRDSDYIDVTNVGMITKSGITKTEKAWLKYEEAWVKYAAIKCPDTPDYAVKTYFTKQRTLQLKELAEY